jgi:hypothetical protein
MGEENFGVADLHPEDKDTPLNKKSGRPSPGRPPLCVLPSNLGFCPIKRKVCIGRANFQISTEKIENDHRNIEFIRVG